MDKCHFCTGAGGGSQGTPRRSWNAPLQNDFGIFENPPTHSLSESPNSPQQQERNFKKPEFFENPQKVKIIFPKVNVISPEVNVIPPKVNVNYF